MQRNEFYIDKPKRSLTRIISLMLALGLVVILTIGAYFYTKVNQAASSVSVPVDFSVAKGQTTKEIARALSDQNIIGSYWSFILYAKLHDAGGKIQAGSYILDRNMSIAQIIEVLTKGKVVSDSRRITFIEGQTNDQMMEQMEEQGLVKASDFREALLAQDYDFDFEDAAEKFSMQGFLFPDTYEFGKSVSAKDVVQKMLNNFESKITPQMRSDMAAKNLSMDDVVILASIIEKEVGRNKSTVTAEDVVAMSQERKLVASVFYNRLSIDMALESDATVNYITGKSTPSVSISDTKINSPYNTYLNRGLPPTPIANPGLDSIMAAIYPADSDYIYFLSKPDGEAVFSKTLAEHNANKAKYLK